MRNNTPKQRKQSSPARHEQWGKPKRELRDMEYPEPAPMTNETMIVHPTTGQRMSGWEFEKEVQEIRAICGTWPAPEPLKTYILSTAASSMPEQAVTSVETPEKLLVFAGEAAVGEFCMAA